MSESNRQLLSLGIRREIDSYRSTTALSTLSHWESHKPGRQTKENSCLGQWQGTPRIEGRTMALNKNPVNDEIEGSLLGNGSEPQQHRFHYHKFKEVKEWRVKSITKNQSIVISASN